MAALTVIKLLRFFAARCDASAGYAVMRCVSVTFVNFVKTGKHIVRLFSPSGRPTILVFSNQTGRQSDGDPSNGGFE